MLSKIRQLAGLRNILHGLSEPSVPSPAAEARSTKQGINTSGQRQREVEAMMARFPFLKSVLDHENQDPDGLYRQACEIIAFIHPPAREAAYRSVLKQIGTTEALRAIALSDLREGIPYSSNVRMFPDLWDSARSEVLAHEELYGGALFTANWPSLSRGRALTCYFSNHVPTGTVLHIAPERETEEWMRTNVRDYRTLGLGPDNDLAEDLTDLPLPDNSVDLVICHRVLEHIFDERAALHEIRRILRPCGVLNVSVPESMHLPATLDWCYPDSSHHNHYRHYGSDFESRLNSAGFETEVERWLLNQPEEKLRAAGTCPFRMYNAYA